MFGCSIMPRVIPSRAPIKPLGNGPSPTSRMPSPEPAIEDTSRSDDLCAFVACALRPDRALGAGARPVVTGFGHVGSVVHGAVEVRPWTPRVDRRSDRLRRRRCLRPYVGHRCRRCGATPCIRFHRDRHALARSDVGAHGAPSSPVGPLARSDPPLGAGNRVHFGQSARVGPGRGCGR